ncbi:MAG: DUF1080 domain-containing protein [Planctomycetota bacterium]|nr:DUF1080 domain-containing protein [Planctomycetota bacterium]
MKLLTAHRLAVVATALILGIAAIVAVAEDAAPAKPFNGKDLTGWKCRGDAAKSQWVVGAAKLDPDDPTKLAVEEGGSELINKSRGVDLYSEQKFGDCLLTIEVMVPKGSNSGIYLMGNYEIQVLDSFGKDNNAGPGDMGGIYGAAAPKNPKYKAPGEWQKFEVHFVAPKFEDGKKVANAKFVKMVLNGVTIHENVEVKGVTGGAMSAEAATGPLMFQGDHGPVAFHNIEIRPLK